MDYPSNYNGYQQQNFMPQQYPYGYGTGQQAWMPPRQSAPQQQPQANRGIVGRVVASESDIRPDDVTTDGLVSWYPVANGSYVIGRRMNSDGTVSSVRYLPEDAKPPEPTQSDRIEEKLNRLLAILDQGQQREAGDAR